MSLRQLIYVSAARRDLGPDAYLKILATARRRNAQAGVSGMLLSIDQGFLQLLEGTPGSVAETLDRVMADDRQTNLRILYDQPALARSFSGWFMGFDDMRGYDPALGGAFPITRAALTENLPAGLGADILIFIRTFYAVNAPAIRA